MAHSDIAEFFPRQGGICATVAAPPQRKVGMVSILAFFFGGYVGLLSTATKVSKVPATMMKDSYEKLNSGCMRL